MYVLWKTKKLWRNGTYFQPTLVVIAKSESRAGF